MFILSLLLIICIGAFGYLTLTNNKKNDILKQQLMLSMKQNDSLRSKVTSNKQKESINIVYSPPKYNLGIISNDCNLLLAPLDNLPVINTLKENTKVYILDSAEINSNLWFYINLYSDEKVNSKGWIKEHNLSFVEQHEEHLEDI